MKWWLIETERFGSEVEGDLPGIGLLVDEHILNECLWLGLLIVTKF